MSQTIENKPIFNEDVAEKIRELIRQYDGSEVFLVGTCEPDGTVVSVEPMAFGTKNAVPAPAQNATPGQVLIHNHPSGDLQPSEADISIASLHGKSGVGFYITNNTCDVVRIVVKPFFPKQAVPVEFGQLDNLFGRDGHLSQTFPAFEFRPQQLAMMRLVTDAFNDDKIAVIEAGTGVGKSFAYLAPSILWALANKKRVVISTNTINLQEQLLNKDLPELALQMNLEVKAVLAKGRGNYVSLRRLKYSAGRADLFAENRTGEINSLIDWADKTEVGSKSDFPFQVSDDTWEAVNSDKDDCLRAACPTFDKCHFYKSRREAANADVIIANHHLVMADVALRQENSGNDYVGILPPFDRIVFDEAHNLEEVATNYFTSESSLLAIRRQLFKISRTRDRSGLLHVLYSAVKTHKTASRYPVVAEILPMMAEQILPTREEVETALTMYFDEFFADSLHYFHADNLKDNERREFRITTAVSVSPYWAKVRELIESMINHLHRLIDQFDRLDTLINRLPDEFLADIAEPRLRLFSSARKLKEHDAALRFFLSADKDEFCRWIELGYRRGRPYIYPTTAPLDISHNLRNALFTRKNTVVLTSATLSIEEDFSYFTKQVGLHGGQTGRQQKPETDGPPPLDQVLARCEFLKLDTPFDYQKNCIIGIPKDLPAPSAPDFHRMIAPIIVNAVRITEGRAMVLFTSYRALKQVADMCRGPLLQAGITCLQQGEMPRHQLVESFRNARKAALFATSSFWEGVDVQGDALQCLILTKLPFSVPSTPLFEARAELLEKRGGNPFYEIAVPQAVIKFKQGFGRLIRSHSDKGFVLVLDNRVLVQRYGRIFMKSLPPARRAEGAQAEIINEITAFMSETFPL